MIVERVKSGFLAAPDFKVTEFDRRTSGLLGGYAGWLTDRTFFIGAGGYFTPDWSRDRNMAYGGLVVQWLVHADRRIGFGAKGLVGGGRATLATTSSLLDIRDLRDLDRLGDRAVMPSVFDRDGRFVLPVVNVRLRDDFFVAEPEGTVLVGLTRSLRIAAGAGYRFTGGTRGLRDRLDGVTGSIALQIGGGF
jgi:hypothetical protein